MKALIQQILKFGIVGIIAFCIDYGTMILLTEGFSVNYLISSGISFTVSVIFNYIASVRWVFKVHDRFSKAAQFIIFVLLSIGGLVLNTLLMWLLVNFAGIHYALAKIVVTAVVMVYNFITRKIFLEE